MALIDTAVGLVQKTFNPQTFGFLVPFAPGGIIVFGLLLLRPHLSDVLTNYPKVFGNTTAAVLAIFFSYVIGACLLSLLSTLVEGLTGLLRKDAGIYNASGFSSLIAWRMVATEFLGTKLSPVLYGITQKHYEEELAKIEALPVDPSEKALQRLKLTLRPSAVRVDLDWKTWYSVIDDYFRMKNSREFSAEYIPVLHASGWAALLVFIVGTRPVHWALWLSASICTVCGLALSVIAVYLNPPQSDTTAQIAAMLREIRSDGKPALPTPSEVSKPE